MGIHKGTEALSWQAKAYGAYQAMPADKRQALHEWEALHVDGRNVSTSDWPGWVDYIGPFPYPQQSPQYKKVVIPRNVRWAVWKRDDFRCKQCGTRDNLSVDHILAEAKGGTLDMDNLQTLCRPCNSRKGTA